ncbi:MAG: PLDc_N domain-containing protein [Flavobacteriaceae bacterium]|nr:PLDc_N domain-containing protein [Flavobacteriaceae bacterium]
MLQTILLGFIGPWQWIIIGLALTIFILPLIALIDILKNNFSDNNKIIWVLVVLFFPLIGAILYYTIGTKQKVKIEK